MLRVYFAHPVTDYGTEREAAAMDILRREFPGWEIVNPNRADWADAYKQFGMQFFIERCGECDAGAFMAFPNGKIGAGVAKEMQSFTERGCAIYEIVGTKTVSTAIASEDVLSVEETRALIAAIRAPTIETRRAETSEAQAPSRSDESVTA